MRLFIDESGNNGDVNIKTISDQPFFTLSGLIISEEFEKEYSKLENSFRSKGKLQPPEIKSENTYDTNIPFTKDVISLILEHELPIFAEITDKRYSFFANVVSCTIFPLWMKPKDLPFDLMRYHNNKLADHLFYSATDHLIFAYTQTCQFPTKTNFRNYLILFKQEILYGSGELREGLEIAMRELDKMVEYDEIEPEKLLPIPDELKKGKKHWMIPYIPSFVSIYGRVNKFMKQKSILEIDILHDEQLQYDDIIKHYKNGLESNEYSKVVEPDDLKNILFEFEKSNNISFVNSREIRLMQVADLVAGFINRSTAKKIKRTLPHEYEELFEKIITHGVPPVGLNFVMPERELDKWFR